MSLKSKLALFVLAVAACGCSTIAKDPYSANTAEVLFGDNVQRYLAGRRLELEKLQNRIAELDGEILSTLGHLHGLEKDLAAAELRTGTSDRELAALQQEVSAQKALEQESFERAMALEAQRNAMESDVEAAERDQAEDETQVELLKQEVTRLEGEVVVLHRGINRNLSLKAQQYLSNAGTN